MITVAISAMSFLGFSHAFRPRFFDAFASFVAFLVTHLVPAISHRGRRAFFMGRTAGVSLSLAMFVMRRTSVLFCKRAICEECKDADCEA
jgi:hypothetical protein|tara:strand:- start:2853 stop:3122 length:270 start_codon:yes stop_codon:yes gene_type:complete